MRWNQNRYGLTIVRRISRSHIELAKHNSNVFCGDRIGNSSRKQSIQNQLPQPFLHAKILAHKRLLAVLQVTHRSTNGCGQAELVRLTLQALLLPIMSLGKSLVQASRR